MLAFKCQLVGFYVGEENSSLLRCRIYALH